MSLYTSQESLKQLDWDLIEERIRQLLILKSDTFHFLTQTKLQQSHIVNNQNILSKYQDNLYDIEKINSTLSLIQNQSHGHSVVSLFQRILKGSYLDFNEVYFFIISLLESFSLYKEHHLILENITLGLRDHYNEALPNKDFRKLQKEFSDLFLNSGEINHAHPQLITLYHRRSQLYKDGLSKLKHFAMIHLKGKQDLIQYDVYQDYLVMIIPSDSYQRKFGDIIGKSESGKTLYIKAKSIQTLNQNFYDTNNEIDHKIEQLIQNILKIIIQHQNFSKYLIDTFIKFDYLRACSHLITKKQYNTFSFQESKKSSLNLTQFFHPLLDGAVKNDLLIEPSKSIMCLSGPNAGGKTITIKSIALIHLLSRLALPLPLEDAEIGYFHKIFYFGRDYQDVESSLSSFTGELKQYESLLKESPQNSLIIIDEIFNSTSSEEASAIAFSILERLCEHNTIIISTHHQTLKTLLHKEQHVLSAHMLYDMDEHRPLYKLQLGTPGSSMALDVFGQHFKSDFTTQILKRSESLLASKTIHYEKLLHDLQLKEHEIDKRIQELRRKEIELENIKDAKRSELSLKNDQEIYEFKKRLDKIEKEYRKKLDSISPELKHSKKENLFHAAKVQATNQSSIKDHKKETNKERSEISLKMLSFHSLKVGDYVYYIPLKQNLKIISIKNPKNIKLERGILKLNAQLSELAHPTETRKEIRNHQKAKTSIQLSSSREDKLQYDCRGMRKDEYLSTLTKAYDQLLVGTSPFVDIIHGMGDGFLIKYLMEFLKDHKQITKDESYKENPGASRLILAI